MTLTVQSIGIGRDFTSIAAWEAATESSGNIQRGEVYDDKIYDESLTITGLGSPSAANHRQLVAADGEKYSPLTNTGVRIITADLPLTLEESFTQVSGIRVETTGNKYCLLTAFDPTPTDLLLVDSYFKTDEDSVFDCLSLTHTSGMIYNCIVVGGSLGINKADAGEWNIYNCTVYKFKDYGIALIYGEARNNIAIDPSGVSTLCFEVTQAQKSNNVASDNSVAAHANSYGNESALDILTDPDGDDFTPKGNALNNGITLGVFTHDIADTYRPQDSGWDIGAYEYIEEPAVEPDHIVVGWGMIRIGSTDINVGNAAFNRT